MTLEMNIIHKLCVYAQPILLRALLSSAFSVYDYVHAAIAQLRTQCSPLEINNKLVLQASGPIIS